MTSPLASIVLLTYNQEHFVEEAFLSLLNQDIDNVEIVVSDDCASDATLWGAAAAWSLSSVALLMITTEVSHSPYIEVFLFLVLWTAGIGLNAVIGQSTQNRIRP